MHTPRRKRDRFVSSVPRVLRRRRGCEGACLLSAAGGAAAAGGWTAANVQQSLAARVLPASRAEGDCSAVAPGGQNGVPRGRDRRRRAALPCASAMQQAAGCVPFLLGLLSPAVPRCRQINLYLYHSSLLNLHASGDQTRHRRGDGEGGGQAMGELRCRFTKIERAMSIGGMKHARFGFCTQMQSRRHRCREANLRSPARGDRRAQEENRDAL